MISDHYLKKYSHNPIHNLVYTCWISIQNWSGFGRHWPNFGPLVAKKMTQRGSKWWFPTVIWKGIHTIEFKLGVYTYWVSVQDWFAFGLRLPNFDSLAATKLLKMVISDHYLKRDLWNTIQIWCVHLFGKCSGVWCCFLFKLEYYSSQNLLEFISNKTLISPA